ncbi:MAG TPA: hypothetical protein VF549_18460 [Solirubrobacteraceae bacterium]
MAPASPAAAEDTTPPTLEITRPAEGGTVNGFNALISGTMSDEETGGARASRRSYAPTQVHVTIREADGGPEVAHLTAHEGWNASPQWEGYPPLRHGRWYEAVASATDGAGNTGTSAVRRFRADSEAPDLVLTQPATDIQTTDATLNVAGTGRIDEGDGDTVEIFLESENYQGPVRPVHEFWAMEDDRFAGELPAVPPGRYFLDVTRWDHYEHETRVRRVIDILPTPDAQPPPPPPAFPASSPVDELRAAAVKSFAERRLATLLRRGATVAFQASEPGTASVALLDAAGRRLAAGKRRVLSGRATVRVRPTRRGRRTAARRARSARLRLRLSFTSADGTVARRASAVTVGRRPR